MARLRILYYAVGQGAASTFASRLWLDLAMVYNWGGLTAGKKGIASVGGVNLARLANYFGRGGDDP